LFFIIFLPYYFRHKFFLFSEYLQNRAAHFFLIV
jgi:hypothetical protein